MKTFNMPEKRLEGEMFLFKFLLAQSFVKDTNIQLELAKLG